MERRTEVVQRMPGPSVCLWWSYEQERMAKIMKKKNSKKRPMRLKLNCLNLYDLGIPSNVLCFLDPIGSLDFTLLINNV